jgi:hypothetical protein
MVIPASNSPFSLFRGLGQLTSRTRKMARPTLNIFEVGGYLEYWRLSGDTDQPPSVGRRDRCMVRMLSANLHRWGQRNRCAGAIIQAASIIVSRFLYAGSQARGWHETPSSGHCACRRWDLAIPK